MRNTAAIVLILTYAAAVSSAAEFHVAPAGTPQGNGSAEKPWDLTTALTADAVAPGDTLWLHEGTYRGGYVSKLKGTRAQPITVRATPGEHVIIDTKPRDERDNGLFSLGGADAIYRDLEVTCSAEKRDTAIGGSWPADIRRGSVDIRGSRIAVVNCIVHDQSGGFGFWSEGEGGEISGCLIFNNGWQGPDRAHGHGIYVQNERGTKRMIDNIVFHQFAYGIHAYGSDKASLKGLEIAGNICFENGCLARGGDRSPGIMVGGGCPAGRIEIRDNVVFGGSIRLGYPWGVANDDAQITGNYCDGGLVLRDFRQAVVKGNTIAAGSTVVQLEGADKLLKSGLRWDKNEYFLSDGRWGETAVVEDGKSRGLTFKQWQQETGCDEHSSFTKGRPPKLRVVVWPNAHEPGRGHIAVINPQKLAEVEVDLDGVLSNGQKYRVVSAKDFYGPAVASGIYAGPIRLAMTPSKALQPVGMPQAKLPQTEPEFAAFVVLPE